MTTTLNFLGLSLSAGQPHQGVAEAGNFARRGFSQLETRNLKLIDQGTISQNAPEHHRVFNYQSLQNIDWTPYQEAYQKVKELLKTDLPLLNWGGDHSIGIATAGAFCETYPEGVVIWVDAHADINLPQYSQSGNIHGMPLAILMNLESIAELHFPWIKTHLAPENLIYVGVRDIDPYEKQILEKLNIQHISAECIHQKGLPAFESFIKDIIQDRHVHISFDIDSVSPEYARATGLLVPDGLTPSDLRELASIVSTHARIKSVDVAEINPLLEEYELTLQTQQVALDFIENIFINRPNKNNKGSLYDDDIGRTAEKLNPASLEPGSQI